MSLTRQLERVGIIALLLGNPVLGRGVSAASTDSFPARLPANRWYSDNGSSDDSEQSDPEEWETVTNTSALLKEDETVELPVNDSQPEEVQQATITEPEEESEEHSSQPLQTLHKLQQMLDETDYMTTRRPKERASSTDTTREATKSIKDDTKQIIPKLEPQTPTNDMKKQVPKKPDPPGTKNTVAVIQSPSEKTTTLSTSSMENKNMAAVPKKPDPPASGESSSSTARNKTTLKPTHPPEKLWTSRDRSKYKKQQRLQRRTAAEATRTERGRKARIDPPIQPFSSDDEEGSEDYDDGLGYTLPNLPVYYSDAEADSETENDAESKPPPQTAAPPVAAVVPPPQPYVPPASNYQYGGYGPRPYYPPPEAYSQQQVPYEIQQQQQQQQQAMQQIPQQPPVQQQQQPYPYPPPQGYPPYMYPPNSFPYPYPPNYFVSPQQQQHLQFLQQQQMQQQQQQQYPYWSSSPVPPSSYQVQPRQQLPRVLPKTEPKSMTAPTKPATPVGEPPSQASTLPPKGGNFPVVVSNLPSPVVLQEPPTKVSPSVNLRSLREISFLFITVAMASYCAVSPRTLPLVEYNARFHENLRIVALATIVPAINFLAVFDKHENDINSVIHTLFTSFTIGYALTFVVEIIVTTIVRLGVFSCLEPDIFALTPRVPVPILPWVLRDNKYRPKRITLFAADFCTSCVASPIVEEYIKLLLLQWTVRLPQNFQWVTKTNRKGKKRNMAEAVARRPGELEVTNANPYVTHMLAASVGLKLCDAARRILMYTKAQHADKSFYAFCRGVFPIQELCGTMTAIGLAKRDLLGMDMPLWKILLPAVVVHGMANFRGMKPIFKWNSATPWSEMQLSPLQVPASSNLLQMARKNYPKLMWFIILSRVLGYCIKNYFMVNRQARKRTTTYAGKHAAFSAELATAEMLKKK